jgi:flagellar hook-associated protein 3 FlgL
MRVTEAQRFSMLRRDLLRSSGDIAEVSAHLSSGKQILRLSDDPEMAVQAERLTARDSAIEAYMSAADNARGWLSTQDAALQGAVNVMQRARELTIAAGSTNGPQAREGLALEMEGLRTQLIDIANTSFNGRSVFGGFADRAIEIQAGTAVFVGDDGIVQRRISEDRVVQVNTKGRDAFGFAAGDDVFGFLDDLATHMRAGDIATITSLDIDRLDQNFDRLTEALGSVGASANQVDRVAELATLNRDALRERISAIMNIDLAETAVEVTLAETAYQAVLAATARLQIPSLVDYLR